MKVWELANSIKGTTATLEEIHGWMVMNRICPLGMGHDLEEGYQPKLEALAHMHCDTKPIGACGPGCYKEFLEMDVLEEGESK